jgi:4-amino-4-deoxy-L-arabinose transferase-like glycosyltransferase
MSILKSLLPGLAFGVQRVLPRRIFRLLWPAGFLFLYCLFLFFHGLTAGDLYRTESLRAIIAAEGLRSGNWIVPTLYGEPLLTKPPGMYAAIGLASWPFGEVTTATARLPSAIAATITVLLFYWYFRRQLGPRAGLIAAVMLPVSILWLDKAPSAEIDMLQLAWVSAAIICFLRATEDVSRTQYSALRTGYWLAALMCVAGGFLTKWTAPVFFYGTIIPFLIWRRQLRLLVCWQHLAGVALAAGLCLTWAAAAIHQVGWETFSMTVLGEALPRLSPSHHQLARESMSHHQPDLPAWAEILLHPVRVLAASLPWSAGALLTLWPGFFRSWDARGRRLLLALHCWTWPNLLFWSILPEHALRHSFPLFPGIAGLAAMLALAWLDGRWRWPLRRVQPGTVLLTTLVFWVLVKLVFVHAVMPARTAQRQPRVKGEQIAAGVPAGETLYLFRLKDEGIMFYYGRPVRRLPGPEHLPSSAEPMYCILDENEARKWLAAPGTEAILHLRDEQGQPIVLVRLRPPAIHLRGVSLLDAS